MLGPAVDDGPAGSVGDAGVTPIAEGTVSCRLAFFGAPAGTPRLRPSPRCELAMAPAGVRCEVD